MPSGCARLSRILHGVPEVSPRNGLANNLVAPSHCRVHRTSNSANHRTQNQTFDIYGGYIDLVSRSHNTPAFRSPVTSSRRFGSRRRF
ncbi:hypothetical protein L916_21614 [Phytophthora nicotianae]|uniref:Uncharacterized protein n=1 Tax=Phytophthora nicotianae TaxID=4792 RepID=W2HR96_PHYNI|nr:hypothetical protein L916_21614 [Phytophthora nicotianae]